MNPFVRTILTLSFLLAGSPLVAQGPDELYRQREDLSSAKRAAEIWSANAATEFDAAWKLARAAYWIGGHAPEGERRASLERGVVAGETAARLSPERPEGHYWLAANMGALAESFGLRQGIKYRTDIKSELETVQRLAPGFLDGSADRALGRWYFKVPRLFGGSQKLAESHLRTSLTYDPDNTASHFFLAELLLDQRRTQEARAELQRVLDVPLNPDWTPEGLEFKEKARKLLASLKSEV
jgi:tetratricopeptide (TPR) repeat protein